MVHTILSLCVCLRTLSSDVRPSTVPPGAALSVLHVRSIPVGVFLLGCGIVDRPVRKCRDAAVDRACADLSVAAGVGADGGSTELIRIVVGDLSACVWIEVTVFAAGGILIRIGRLVLESFDEHVEAGGEERTEDGAHPIDPSSC